MEKNIYSKRLRARLAGVLVLGLVTYLIDDWAVVHQQYRIFVYFVVCLLLLIAILADATRGTLKSSPFYKATFSEALDTKPVQKFMFLYFLGFLVLFMAKIINGTDISGYLHHPFYLYIFFAPILSVVYLSMYFIETKHDAG